MLWKTAVGSATLYGIRDGRSDRDPLDYLVGSTAEALSHQRRYLNADGTMPNSFSCYLFDNGTHRTIIDTGFGVHGSADADVGHMPDALTVLGVSAADVDHVVFTHLHPDHILGSLDMKKEPLFANAAHRTVRREIEYWRAGTDERSLGIAAIANVLDDAGMLTAVEDPGQIIPGVTTHPAYGHTPGHTSVRVWSGDQSVFIAGDITFSPIQVDHTDWSFPKDVDPVEATATRERFFSERMTDGVVFAAGHYDAPGLGRLVVTSDGR